jgi:hypothetical protein
MAGGSAKILRGWREWTSRMRAAGHRVVLIPGWEDRGQGAMDAYQTLTNHHTAGSLSGPAPSLNVVTFGRSDLRGLLSQIFSSREWQGAKPTAYICGSGVAWQAGVSAWNGWTSLNYRGAGWEHENTGTGEPWKPSELEMSLTGNLIFTEVFEADIVDCHEHYECALPEGRKIDRKGIVGSGWRRQLRARDAGVFDEEETMLRSDQARGDGAAAAVQFMCNKWLDALNTFLAADGQPPSTMTKLAIDDAPGLATVNRVQYICRKVRQETVPDPTDNRMIHMAHVEVIVYEAARLRQVAHSLRDIVRDAGDEQLLTELRAQVAALLADQDQA